MDIIRLMQSSQRPMKESLEVAVDAVRLGFDRMIGLRISNVMALQSKSSLEVVKKSSFPSGKSRYTSFRRGNRSSSGGGSCKCQGSSTKLGIVGGGILRQPT